MTYYIILGILFVLIFTFWYFGRKPVIHRNISQDNLINYLEVLFNRGYDGGFIIIQTMQKKKLKRMIQFSKYIDNKKKVGLQFDYPLAKWSLDYYEKLKYVLEKNKIEYETEKTDEEHVPEFLVIDIKTNLKKAEIVSKLVLQEVYGLRASDLVKLYFVNVSPDEEKIGF